MTGKRAARSRIIDATNEIPPYSAAYTDYPYYNFINYNVMVDPAPSRSISVSTEAGIYVRGSRMRHTTSGLGLFFLLLMLNELGMTTETVDVTVPPELFAPNVISTPDDEFGLALTPDGGTAFFTKRSPTTNTPSISVICVSYLRGKRWSEPEVARFSGFYNDFGVAIAPDGQHLVFSSDRPADGAFAATHNIDLWIIDKDGDDWSNPRNLGSPINTAAVEAYPSLAADGTLYFASNRSGGAGAIDIFRARLVDGKYAEPENLAELNSAASESQPAINGNQTILVFASTGRDDALATNGAPYPRPDLYASFQTNGHWSAPLHLSAPVNSSDNEGNPSFSPDATLLFFSSDRGFVDVPMRRRLTTSDYERGVHSVLNGWNNIFSIPVSAIPQFRRTPVSEEPK